MSIEQQDTPAGLSCFISQDRVCGPDCMAFLAQSPTGTTYIGQQWAHCLFLVSVEKTSRHLTIIAGETAKAAAAEQRKAPAPGVK